MPKLLGLWQMRWLFVAALGTKKWRKQVIALRQVRYTDSGMAKVENKVGMIAKNSSVYNPPTHYKCIIDLCRELSFILSSLPCFLHTFYCLLFLHLVTFLSLVLYFVSISRHYDPQLHPDRVTSYFHSKFYFWWDSAALHGYVHFTVNINIYGK